MFSGVSTDKCSTVENREFRVLGSCFGHRRSWRVYTGHEKDAETGLEYAQARYYNPTHGRYTSIDPMTASATIKNPQTFNRYSYVLNSPYKFVDPLGLISAKHWRIVSP